MSVSKRKSVCLGECETERESACMFERVCMLSYIYEREKEKERESEREREINI